MTSTTLHPKPSSEFAITPDHGGARLAIAFDSAGKLLSAAPDEIVLPPADILDYDPESRIHIGRLGDFTIIAASVRQSPEQLHPVELRQALGIADTNLVPALCRAHTLTHWLRRCRYCGNCGKPTSHADDKPSRLCAACGELYFPVIAPATITAVTRGDSILLAANHNFRPGLYSIIAGFVEAGESLEECVRREIREEVGIEVTNIRYADSQPWPFPNSLMVGFTAEYASGDIRPDGLEIIDAAWFHIDKLPQLPSPVSISRRLIDGVVGEIMNRRGSGQ